MRSLTRSTKEGPKSVMAPVLLCLLLLMLVSNISTTSTTPNTAVPVAALTDLPSFVYYQYGRNFSDQWKKCIEDGSNKCPWYYSVGKQGPCHKGEIFVYNRTEVLHTNRSFEPICQPAPCPDGYSLVLPYKKCYHDDDIDSGICSLTLDPIRNMFGETFCGCEGWEATILGSKKKECHTLFTQGPCAKGSSFVPVNDFLNFGQGQCLPSPCAKLLNETQGAAKIRLPNGRTKCFKHYSRGSPCEDIFLGVHYSESVFPGVQHLQCTGGGTPYSFSYFASSERCVVNDEGLCVLSLKNKPVEPRRLQLEES